MKKQFSTMWSSPTLMTWGSFFAQSISLLVVLPLMLTQFGTEEISLWYLFMTLLGFQRLADLGFSPTFSRVIAFSMGGANIQDLRSPKGEANGKCNEESLGRLCATMRFLYARLGFGWTLLLGIFGTLALHKPISLVFDQTEAWLAWGVVVICSLITFRGSFYATLLQGINRVALLRRYEMIVSLLTTSIMAFVLLEGGRFLVLVVVYQLGKISSILLNRWLVSTVVNSDVLGGVYGKRGDFEVLSAVWPSAIRSSLGQFMSYGFIQGSGVVYAQLGSVEMVATYLLTLRLFNMLSQFSEAPFYSKLPSMARNYVEGKKAELIKVAQHGMLWSYWSYVTGFIFLALFGPNVLIHIGSNVDFPSPLLWSLLGLGFFAQRFAAMHIQLYSNTNRIVWHISNGVSGGIFFVVSMLTFPLIGLYAFPCGVLSGSLGFMIWYAAHKSYKEFDLHFFSFEKGAVLCPAFSMLLFLLFYMPLSYIERTI